MAKYRQKGKKVLSCGHCIGIVDGDWRVPYIPGDVTNASTYDYPVLYEFIEELDLELVLAGDPSQEAPIIAAVKALAAQGVRGITGDCGFLIHYQEACAKAVDIPVFMSSLMQLPLIDSFLGKGRAIGIVCADRSALDESVLAKAGFSGTRSVHIAGMQDQPEFKARLLQPGDTLDSDRIESEVTGLCRQLQAEDPELGALLLECSMLPPYSHAIQAATGLPVFDFITMIDYFQRVTFRQAFTGYY